MQPKKINMAELACVIAEAGTQLPRPEGLTVEEAWEIAPEKSKEFYERCAYAAADYLLRELGGVGLGVIANSDQKERG